MCNREGSVIYSFDIYGVEFDNFSIKPNTQKVKSIQFEILESDKESPKKGYMIFLFENVSSEKEILEISKTIKDDVLDSIAFGASTKIDNVKMTGFGLNPLPNEGAIGNFIFHNFEIEGYIGGIHKLKQDEKEQIEKAFQNAHDNISLRLYRYGFC